MSHEKDPNISEAEKVRRTWKNKPYPELVEFDEVWDRVPKDRKTWVVKDIIDANAEGEGMGAEGAVNPMERVIMVPLRNRSSFVNAHELGHVRWSPKKPPRVRYPMVVLQAVEDARINLGLRNLGMMPGHFSDPVFGDIEEATWADHAAGHMPNVILRAIAMLGTPAERRMRKVLKELPDGWGQLAQDWMGRVEREYKKSARLKGAAVGTFTKCRQLAKTLAEELALEEEKQQSVTKVRVQNAYKDESEDGDGSGTQYQAEASDEAQGSSGAPNPHQVGDDDDQGEAEGQEDEANQEAQGLPEDGESKDEDDGGAVNGTPQVGGAPKERHVGKGGVKRKKPKLQLKGSMSRSAMYGRTSAMMAGVRRNHEAERYRPRFHQTVNPLRYKIGERYVPTADDVVPHRLNHSVEELWRDANRVRVAQGETWPGPQWAPMVFKKIKLTVPQRSVTSLRSRMPGSAVEGAMIRRPDRMLIDGAIFARKRSGMGATVLVDNSGSMSISPGEIEQICVAAGGQALVACYAGYGQWHGGDVGYGNIDPDAHGELRIVADGDRRAATDELHVGWGGNFVDLPALMWMAKYRGPKVWVSDGLVVGSNGHGREHWYQCRDFCVKNGIVRVPNATWAVRYLMQELTGSIEKKMHTEETK